MYDPDKEDKIKNEVVVEQPTNDDKKQLNLGSEIGEKIFLF